MNDYRGPEWTGRGPSDAANRHPKPGPYGDGPRLDGKAPPMPATSRPRRPSSSRHRSSSSSKRKIQRLRLFVVVLTTALVASLVFSVMLYFQLKRVRSGETIRSVEQKQMEGELAKARERIIELNNDLRILLANRLPGIDQLIFNRQIELNEQYLKNITFVRSGLGDDTTVEFSAVLHNARTGPILPKVTIVLFDESGLQTGAVTLDKSQTVSPVDIPEMQPGETRTYSARIDLQRNEPAKYFVAEVR